ncbi:hypothetical protein MMC08_001438, partial [Hypocenomyce scalaris]|nr:hypothetical protein [Hypocenomyce scalaris]
MSGKLDQSLDEILSTRRQTARGRGRGRRAPNPARTNGATVAAPVGGIKKNTKVARGGAKATVPSGPAAGGDSKIIVSNLPPDVNETQIKTKSNWRPSAYPMVKRTRSTSVLSISEQSSESKTAAAILEQHTQSEIRTMEPPIPASGLPTAFVGTTWTIEYFVKSVGPVRRVTITYGPNGVSRGIATIIFSKPGSANEALAKLNGLLVDKRPMKIEVVLDASRAPPPAPVKGLSERIVQPKGQPKPATAAKSATDGASTRGTGRGRGRGGRRGRNAGRSKPKTAEELD